MDFAAHCILLQDNGTSSAYLGINSNDKNGNLKIHCLNGTDSRENAKFIAYNQDPRKVGPSNLSSITTEKLLNSDDNLLIYSVKTIIPDGSPLIGTYQGLRVLSLRVAESRVLWIKYHFLIHTTKGTVMKFFHRQMTDDATGMICRNKKMPVSYMDYSYLHDYKNRELYFNIHGGTLPQRALKQLGRACI